MKKIIIRLLFSVGFFMTIALAASAQHYIKEPIPKPLMGVRPRAPHTDFVWLDEDWKWVNGRYSWAGGHWMKPPYQGAVWVPGRWHHDPAGAYWVPGKWKKE